MSTVARAAILQGPGYATWDSETFHTTGDLTATPGITTFDVTTSRSGKVDSRVDDVIWPVTFTPTGDINSTLVGKLFPAHFTTPAIGASIFAATAKPLVIVGVNETSGNQLTFTDAALTKMPTLTLSAARPAFGAVEFTAIRKDNTAWTDTSSIFSIGNNASPAAGDSDPDAIVTEPYSAAWGELLADIETEGGWTIEPVVQLQARKIDRQGTVDFRIVGVECMAKCVPVAATLANIANNMPIQGANMARGVSPRVRGEDLEITGSALSVTLFNATLVQGGFRWGTTTLRQNEIGFVAHRSYATGSYGALFSVTAA